MRENKEIYVGPEARDDFREMCESILPAVEKIIQVMRENDIPNLVSLTLSADGYFSFFPHGTCWSMSRVDGDSAPRIKYEFGEEISIPETGELQDIEYSHHTENLMEISMKFADMARADSSLYNIESENWKQKFIDWANEFEKIEYGDDYLIAVSEFAEKKIKEYMEDMA